MNGKLNRICAGLALACVPASVAAQSWDGMWKMNWAKSRVVNEFEIKNEHGGKMRLSDSPFRFMCNGWRFVVSADLTQTCTGSPETGYDFVFQKRGGFDGKVVKKTHWTFSADGKTATIHGTMMRDDGTSWEYTNIYQRQAGKTGLIGKWLDENVTPHPEGNPNIFDSMVIERKDDWIRIYWPKNNQRVEGVMDGTPLSLTGDDVPPGSTQSIDQEGPNKLHYLVKMENKVVDEGVQTLSADGQTLTDESWTPGKTNERATSVFERQ